MNWINGLARRGSRKPLAVVGIGGVRSGRDKAQQAADNTNLAAAILPRPTG
jgi:hypothetical protein